MIRSHVGRQIDAHEFVIRLNLAPVGGFEQAVGNRTSLRVVNSDAIGCLVQHRACAAAGSGSSSFCPRYGIFANSPGGKELFRACGSVMSPYLRQHDFNASDPVLRLFRVRGTNFMTGAWAVALAMRLCPRGATAFGFTHRATRAMRLGEPYHYYDNRTLNSVSDDLESFAAALSRMADAEPQCLRLHVPAATGDAPVASGPASPRPIVDPLVDGIVYGSRDGAAQMPAAGAGRSCRATGGRQMCCVPCQKRVAWFRPPGAA